MFVQGDSGHSGGRVNTLVGFAQVLEEGPPDVDSAGDADDGGEEKSLPAGSATTPTHQHRFQSRGPHLNC